MSNPSAPRANFRDADHALASGIILGALLRGVGEPNGPIADARPYMDGADYTNQILVQIGEKFYAVTVDEAVAEALE